MIEENTLHQQAYKIMELIEKKMNRMAYEEFQ